MQEFDEVVLSCFVKKQLQLFPEKIVQNTEEAEIFLEECMAVVLEDADQVWEYFEEQGVDIEGMSREDLVAAEEVFEVGDGRYLVVEC